VLRYAILAWSVAIACWLAAGILMQQLRGPIALATTSSSFTPYLDGNDHLAFNTHVTTSPVSIGLALLFYGALSAMWAVLVAFVARGANWARITQTVLGAIGGAVVLMQAVWSLRGSGAGAILPGWLDVAALLAIATAILAMYLPAVNAYFAGRPLDAPRPVRQVPPRPAVITRAMLLVAIGAGLGLVGDVLRMVLPATPPHTSMITGVAVAGTSPGSLGWLGTVAATSVGLLIQAALLVHLGRGARWARIVQTILVALDAMFLPVSLILTLASTPALIVSRAFAVVVFVLQVVAVLLLYQPAANAFFAAGATTAQPLRPDQS
jgi:hypothetical protein